MIKSFAASKDIRSSGSAANDDLLDLSNGSAQQQVRREFGREERFFNSFLMMKRGKEARISFLMWKKKKKKREKTYS